MVEEKQTEKNKEESLKKENIVETKKEENKENEKGKEKIAEESIKETKEEKSEDKLASWVPKTKIGKLVKEKKITNIDEILDKYKILEPEIVDSLLVLKSDLLAIGQAKGKFGGGKRRVWRQTQKKTAEGNVPTFACMAVVGDENGHVGIGYGKAKETLPAREKAIRNAKLNIIKINRACSSFDCSCNEPHTVPFIVEGKSGSVRLRLLPAPQGTGLVIGDEGKKILRLAGIKDVYSKTLGQTRTTINYAKACIDALKKTVKK
ncbi:MAG: 30S ribosomal protein S5 [Candidatus Pacearchaeota archaeon]